MKKIVLMQDKMLQETVSRLYLIASGAPHENTSQTHDQSSVHAFNILKAIFSDASLAGDLFSHLGRMVQLVITCFESASWAIRNAAAQVASEYCSFFLNFFYLYIIFFSKLSFLVSKYTFLVHSKMSIWTASPVLLIRSQ